MQKDDTGPKNMMKTADQPWCLKAAPTAADQLVIGLSSKIEEQRKQGKKIYALTVTYREARDVAISPDQAIYYFRRFHHDLLCYLANSKNISRSWFRAIEPSVHVFVDLPFSKRKAAAVQPRSLRMSALHHHCVVISNEAHVKKLDAIAADDDAARGFVQSLRDACAVRTIKIEPIGSCPSDLIRWLDYSSSYAIRRSRNLRGLADHYDVLPISSSEHQNKNKNNQSGETSMIAKANHHHQPYEHEKRIDAGSRIITNRTRYLQSRYEAHGWNKRALLEHVFTRAAFVQSLSEFLVDCAAIGQNEARRAALRLAISAERTS